MARTVDPVAHAVRRDAFLDAALRLIQAKGYAQLSIQDVINDTGASKGAFYHYFDSKVALLDAAVTRMVEQATASLEPALADPDRTALQKFESIFTGLAGFKAERRELILAMMQVWLSDENVMVREKFRLGVIARMTPIVAAIIRQGVAEGSFATDVPDRTAHVFMSLFMATNEAASRLFADHLAGDVTFEEAAGTLAAFGDALERILGARPGALGFEQRLDVLREWFDISTSRVRGGST